VPADSAGRAPLVGTGDAARAALGYAALAVAVTWPLALGLARDLPGDFGDPLLNCWILAWDAEHLLRALGGHLGALTGYWNANIFYPHPLALAYSDHLTMQAVQILPVYAITHNAVLCYNLLFLSTFVLSGLGMFLFARELTGSRPAAFLAGLAYAFAPYRVGSTPHLQVLSSAWMPFALFGFRRFFDTRRTRPLAGAAAAWLAQNLSCSYYLVFFSPVLGLYLAWELTTRRLWSDARTLARVAVAAVAVVLATLPFVLPYVQLRRLGFAARSLGETTRFSANVYAYLTADPNARLWGNVMRAWPHLENALFPGLTILTLAAIGIVAAWRQATPPGDARRGEMVLGRMLAGAAGVLVAMVLGWTMRLPFLKITSPDRVAWLVAGLSAAWLAVSRRARETTRAWIASPPGILALLTLFAVVMSFGPHIYSREKLIEPTSLYAFFYRFVPGFDGLRVPARFGMIVALGLAALTGYGGMVIARLKNGRRLEVLAALLIVAEFPAVPLPLNGNDTTYKQSGLAPLPASVPAGVDAPPVYRFIATLPASASLVEMPFGEPAFEVRYMYYSTMHWRPLANGYSGGAPDEYGLLSESFKDAIRRPGPAWRALIASGVTHVVVHEAGYADRRGGEISNWLRTSGAKEIAAFGDDHVFALPRPPAPSP
jgi:hypothetical protein